MLAIWIGIYVVAAVAAAVLLVRALRGLRGQKGARGGVLFGGGMILSVLVTAAAFLLNAGWLRVILLWFCLPAVHTFLVFLIGSKALPWLHRSVVVCVMACGLLVTYAAAYVFLPDFMDYGPPYVFFSFIRNDAVVLIAWMISSICYMANIVCMILTYVFVRVARANAAVGDVAGADLSDSIR